MFRAQLGVGDAVGQLITFAIVSGIYSLMIVFLTIFMKMKAKDRLVVFITSFITMMDICFFAFSMMYLKNYIIGMILTFLMLLVLPILVGGLIYNNILKYKKMKGIWVALITHGTLLAINILLSVSYNMIVLSRINNLLQGI